MIRKVSFNKEAFFFFLKHRRSQEANRKAEAEGKGQLR